MTVPERLEVDMGKAANCHSRCTGMKAELVFRSPAGLEGQVFCAVTCELLLQEAGLLLVL